MARYTLVDYLLRLAKDHEETERFRKSAESARECMKEAGLSEEDQELLLHGDSHKISEAVAKAFPIEAGAVFIKMSVCFTAPPPRAPG